MNMKIQKIGIVGSGNIGGALGILLGKAGYEVLFSSRHPDRLRDLTTVAGPRSRTGTVAEAVAFGDVVIMSLPLKAMPELGPNIKEALKGKVVIDTSNPYPERDGKIAEDARKDPAGMGVFVARIFPGARIVRAFNTVYYVDLRKTMNKHGDRIGIPIAGDDEDGVRAAVELIERAGLDPIVVGGLESSKLFDVGSVVYATSASAREIREKLQLGPASTRAA
jgi:predicted dinucleotide-binding enzyme